jgi:hypothetical protein
MTAVFFVMRFDTAPIVIWSFELPLDQQVRPVRVIRILLGLEESLAVARRLRRWPERPEGGEPSHSFLV